ncbi:MAG: exodeoxyribonuclease III, partial [Clostridia bacterium]|nr:exodeoxyribonuclease III [Clostridia bacterium]
MKFISFNVNGLRACANKGFFDFLKAENPDFLCVQETKLQDGQMDLYVDGYYDYLSSAEKKGYSGTLIYAKNKPIAEIYGIDGKYNDEGRVITLEYENFYLVNAYVPNSQEELK